MKDMRRLWLVTARVEREVQAYVLADTKEEAEKGYTFKDLQNEDCIDEHDFEVWPVEKVTGKEQFIAAGWSETTVPYGDNGNEEDLGAWIEKSRLRTLEDAEDAKMLPLFPAAKP